MGLDEKYFFTQPHFVKQFSEELVMENSSKKLIGKLGRQNTKSKKSTYRKLELIGTGSDQEPENLDRNTYYKVSYLGKTALIDLMDLHQDHSVARNAFKRRLYNQIQFPILDRTRWNELHSLIKDYQNNPADFNLKTFRVARGIGWQNKVYITPNHYHAATKNAVEVFHADYTNAKKWATRGELDDWKKYLAAPSGKRSQLLVFLICVAFVPPLLSLLKRRGFGVNLVGKPQSGKTTATAVAGTVWGGGGQNGFMETWKISKNGIEDHARDHKDALLCMDDTSRITCNAKERAEILWDAIFCYDGGHEKKRKGLGLPDEWNGILLSSSNEPAVKILRDGGKEWGEQFGSRFLEITIDKNTETGEPSILDSISGKYNTHREYIDKYLAPKLNRYYGTPIEGFLKKLSKDWRDAEKRKELKLQLRSYENLFTKKCIEKVERKGMARAENAFALIYAAGRLAQQYGLVPWDDKTINTAIKWAYLNHHRSYAKNRPLSPVLKIKNYILKNRRKFLRLSDAGAEYDKLLDPEFENVLGFIQGNKYIIPKNRFLKEFYPDRMGHKKKVIDDDVCSYLDVEANGAQKRRLCKRMKVRSNRVRDEVFVIREKIFKVLP